MIKSYIATRVFVMVDIVMGVLFLVGLIIGFHVLLAYAAVVTIIWCTIVIPLAWLGVWSVGHRLQLVHRKHTFDQYLYEQHAQKDLANYNPPPPLATIHQQNNILSNQPVALNGQPADGRTLASGHVIDEETDRETDKRKVLFYVQQYPKSGYREIGRAVGFGRTKVGELINELKQEGQL
jgi:hypothetical protein